MLHDVGKIKINTAILKKTDKLSDTEYDHLKFQISNLKSQISYRHWPRYAAP
jgi:response regulator RpfG family c-di-GMP phosphodiesterase